MPPYTAIREWYSTPSTWASTGTRLAEKRGCDLLGHDDRMPASARREHLGGEHVPGHRGPSSVMSAQDSPRDPTSFQAAGSRAAAATILIASPSRKGSTPLAIAVGRSNGVISSSPVTPNA